MAARIRDMMILRHLTCDRNSSKTDPAPDELAGRPPETDLRSDLVLQYVRRVRNNFFHDGKFSGRWFEPERSTLLLKHSLRTQDQPSPRARRGHFDPCFGNTFS